jgi:hypothetical protein
MLKFRCCRTRQVAPAKKAAGKRYGNVFFALVAPIRLLANPAAVSPQELRVPI